MDKAGAMTSARINPLPAVIAMAAATLADLVFLYRFKHGQGIALHDAGFVPWGMNPFYVHLVPGHSLALADPPAMLDIVPPSLLAGLLAAVLAGLLSRLRGGVSFSLMWRAASFLAVVGLSFWEWQGYALSDAPPCLVIDLDAGHITSWYAPPIGLDDIASYYIRYVKQGMIIEARTQDGWSPLIGIAPGRDYDTRWEAEYVEASIQKFIASHGAVFPVK